MANIWPPSPCVEDEEVSLAREHGSDSSDADADHGKAPAVSRGSVDQLPLIIDVNAKDDIDEAGGRSAKKQSEPFPQPTIKSDPGSSRHPCVYNDEKRFVHLPSISTSTAHLGVPSTHVRPRSKSTSRVDGDETPRGRPHVHRLQTDLGGDLHAMPSGQRRAPSPYAYRPSAAVHQATTLDGAKASMLSPESAAAPRPNEGRSRRSHSAHPDRQDVAIESSDSDHNPSRDKHRSKSRHTRPREPKPSISGRDEYVSDRRDSYRNSRQDPPRSRESHQSRRSAQGNITPPQTPSLPQESPYTSAAEQSDRRRRGKSGRPERRYSKESPYTSSNEETLGRRKLHDRDNEAPSRRGSVRRIDKPYLDISNRYAQSKPDPNTPYSGHSPKAMEDYFQRAFDNNRTRQTKRNTQYSAHPSPLTSPPTSPPQTPRRELKTRDYFEMNAPVSPSNQRPRPPSTEDNPIKPLTSMLGAATVGASLSTKVPNVSRSSTASIETPSSGSQGSMASAQRSRKPSPVHEHPQTSNDRPISQAESLAGREELHGVRPGMIANQHDRPTSRAGSTASWEEHAKNRTSIYPLFEERPSSHNGYILTNGLEHPPMSPRTSSYSSYDQQRTRPSSRRTYSANGSATIMPASSYHPPPGPSHLSRMSYSSPTGSERVSTPLPPLPLQTATAAAAEPRTLSFPKCPQPYPIVGHHHWYTVQGLQNFDICTSCASVLGKSDFRDYCVPSWKPPTEAVTCALSRPWTRIAIARALKDGSANVSLLQDLNKLPPGVNPCPGGGSEVRKWYHITDPSTKSPIPNFNVCTACVRSVELLFPDLWREKLFERPEGKLYQEKTCNLNAGSKYFYSIFNELEKLAAYSKKKDLRPKDISTFAAFLRQKTRFRECTKDAMLATTLWHYIPGLFEFTICEECFEEVVWPMRDMPIARDVIKTLQKVPIQRPGNFVDGISCQLYSERMRAIFKNACSRNDFESLRQNALARYNFEHRLQEKHRMLEQDMRAGIDRREEIENNRAKWKAYE